MAARPRSRKRPAVDDDLVIRTTLTGNYFESDGGFFGYVEELTGITAQGRTLEETRERLEQAARIYVEMSGSGVRRRMQAYAGPAHRETFIAEM